MLNKIISGGQSGADIAALDAAIEINLSIGGYCPKGRASSTGVIDDKYPLTEIEGGYHQRTKMNIQHSDGTVIFYDTDIVGGTELTLFLCIKLKKPYKLIDISVFNTKTASQAINSFIEDKQIVILNVAGPNADRCPNMYEFVRNCFKVCYSCQ